MKITKTFVNSFSNLLRAKLNNFLRKSIFMYAIAAGMLTHALDLMRLQPIGDVSAWIYGLICFVSICTLVLALILASALFQSRKRLSWNLTFTEDQITIVHQGETKTHTWGWIAYAEEMGNMVVLFRDSRFCFFIDRKKLDANEYTTLREWLVKHDKLRIPSYKKWFGKTT